MRCTRHNSYGRKTYFIIRTSERRRHSIRKPLSKPKAEEFPIFIKCRRMEAINFALSFDLKKPTRTKPRIFPIRHREYVKGCVIICML